MGRSTAAAPAPVDERRPTSVGESADADDRYCRSRTLDVFPDDEEVVQLPPAPPAARPPALAPVGAASSPRAPLGAAAGAAASASAGASLPELQLRVAELTEAQERQHAEGQAMLAELLREMRALKPMAASDAVPFLIARSAPVDPAVAAHDGHDAQSEPSHACADGAGAPATAAAVAPRSPHQRPSDGDKREGGWSGHGGAHRSGSTGGVGGGASNGRRGSRFGAAALEALHSMTGRIRDDSSARGPKRPSSPTGRSSAEGPVARLRRATRRASITPQHEGADSSTRGARARAQSFLSADHVGDALRNNRELNELIVAIERDQKRELERRGELPSDATPVQSTLCRRIVSVPAMSAMSCGSSSAAASPSTRKSKALGGLLQAQRAATRAQASKLVIHPDNRLKTRWDTLMICAVILSTVTVPFRLAFAIDFEPIMAPVTWIDTVCDIFFALDIVGNFFFGYRLAEEGGSVATTIILSHPAVVQHYARTWLVPDVVSTFPFDLVLGADSDAGRINRSLRMFRMFKLLRVFRMSRALDQLEHKLTALNPAIFRIVKLILLLLLLWHWIGCIWFTVRFFDLSGVPNLISANDPGLVQPAPLADIHLTAAEFAALPADARADARALMISKLIDQYSWIYFWGAATMSGEIVSTPRHAGEAWFTTFVAVLGVFLNAAVIGSASSAFSNLDAASARNKERLDKLRAFLRHKRTPTNISSRVLSYAEFAWTRSRTENERWLMQELPSTLRLQVMISLQRKLFTQIELFMRLPVAISCSIISCMKPLICLPDEEIMSSSDNVGLFFITEGTVSVIRRGGRGSADEKTGELRDGDFFGERSLLGSFDADESIVAQGFVNLMVLYATEFKKLSEAHPEIADTMAKLRDNQQRAASAARALVTRARAISGNLKRRPMERMVNKVRGGELKSTLWADAGKSLATARDSGSTTGDSTHARVSTGGRAHAALSCVAESAAGRAATSRSSGQVEARSASGSTVGADCGTSAPPSRRSSRPGSRAVLEAAAAEGVGAARADEAGRSSPPPPRAVNI